jgi:hypothetical protein
MLLSYAFSADGHRVFLGDPITALSTEITAAVIAITSPVSPRAKHVLGAAQLIDKCIREGIPLVLLLTDPAVSKVFAGHRNALSSPDSLLSTFLLPRRKIWEGFDMDAVFRGLSTVLSPPSGTSVPLVAPTFSWSRSVPGGISANVADNVRSRIIDVDPTPVLLDTDYVLDCILHVGESPRLGSDRGTHLLHTNATVSQSKSPWIKSAVRSCSGPFFATTTTMRRRVVDGMRACSEARGILEQPILPAGESTTVWWTPWLGMAKLGKCVHLSDPDLYGVLGDAWRTPPSRIPRDPRDLAHIQSDSLDQVYASQPLTSVIEKLFRGNS